jgi:tape measure domain-containing protein
LATETERLIVSLEASVKKFENEMRRARQTAANTTAGITKDVTNLGDKINKAMGTSAGAITAGIGRLGGALGAVLSIQAIKQYADAWTEAGNKIAAAGQSGASTAVRLREVADIAQRSRSDFAATADLYAGLTRSTQDLGVSQNQVAQVTETISKAFALSGSSSAAAAGAITQLNQAFASGVLRGDEFNTTMEQAPIIARLIAKEFGVSVGQLRKMAEAGQLVSSRVFKALVNGQKEIEAAFAQTNTSISQAFTNLNTALTQYIGNADNANSASAKIGAGINALASNMQIVGPALAVLGAALAATFVGGPVAGGVAALTTAFVLFGDSIHPVAGEIATLGDYARSAFTLAQGLGVEAGNAIQAAWQSAAELITNALGAIGTDATGAFDGLLSATKTVLNATIGTFVAAAKAISAVWNGMGAAIADSMVRTMNTVIQLIQSAINKIIGSVNSLIGAVGGIAKGAGLDLGLGEIKPVDLGGITNTYAGAGKAAGEAFGSAFEALSKDYVGDAMGSVTDALAKIKAEATAAADDRSEQQRRNNAARAGVVNSSGTPTTAANPAAAAGGGGKGGGGGGRASKQRLDEFEREVKAIQKRTESLIAENKVVGQSAFEVAKAEAAHKLLAAAEAAHIPITDELKAKIGDLATAYATADTVLEEHKQTVQDTNEVIRGFQSVASEGISGFVQDIAHGTSAVKALENALTKVLDKLLDMSLDIVLNGVGGVGSGGGLLGAFFGKRASGGPVQAGKTYVVGENGPEMVRFGRNGHVTPNSAVAANNNGGGSMVVNITNNTEASVSQKQSQTSNGQQLDVVIDKIAAQKISTPGTASSRALRTGFGLSQGLTRR